MNNIYPDNVIYFFIGFKIYILYISMYFAILATGFERT